LRFSRKQHDGSAQFFFRVEEKTLVQSICIEKQCTRPLRELDFCYSFLLNVVFLLGSLKLDNCPQQNLIPIWLIVGGAVFLAHLLFIVLFDTISSDSSDAATIVTYFSNPLLGTFHFAWFIFGKQ